jgi:D-alanyl-D-alanine carboxypeptidase
MMSTVYINASGLPAEEQITTARDQAILGRAIQHRFPEYYRYFATPSFRYRGIEMRNHNKLLGQVNGVDGIKTGYTDASGYNLVSSVWRNERHIVAVVLGGTSNAARDARMRQLIEEHIPQASAQRTAPKITETAEPDAAKATTTLVDTIGPAPAGQE